MHRYYHDPLTAGRHCIKKSDNLIAQTDTRRGGAYRDHLSAGGIISPLRARFVTYTSLADSASGGRLGVVDVLDLLDLSGFPWPLCDQLRPNLDDHLCREKVETSNLTFCRPFDGDAKVDGNRAPVLHPGINIGEVSTNVFSQDARASAFGREVSFKIHASL